MTIDEGWDYYQSELNQNIEIKNCPEIFKDKIIEAYKKGFEDGHDCCHDRCEENFLDLCNDIHWYLNNRDDIDELKDDIENALKSCSSKLIEIYEDYKEK